MTKKLTNIPNTTEFVGGTHGYTMDPRMVCFEAYHEHNFKIVWENRHPAALERQAKGEKMIIVHEPKTHALIPHDFYVPHLEKIGAHKGEQLFILKIYGNQKFKGLTKPSTSNSDERKFIIKKLGVK